MSAPRAEGRAPQGSAPRTYAPPPRSYAPPTRSSVPPARSYAPPARSYAVPRSSPYGGARLYRPGMRGNVIVGRPPLRGFGPRIAPVRFFRPYYAFRPRLSIGFGLWAGFPITYYSTYYNPFYAPYAYSYPYPYAYPPAYPYPTYPAYNYSYPAPSYPAYPPTGYSSTYSAPTYQQAVPPSPSAGTQSNQDQANLGGVSFEITPGTAEVFVDGSYVGTAGDFIPTTQPLGLTPGRHRVEIRAPGYQTMSFDVDIVAGHVIPYQGVMQP